MKCFIRSILLVPFVICATAFAGGVETGTSSGRDQAAACDRAITQASSKIPPLSLVGGAEITEKKCNCTESKNHPGEYDCMAFVSWRSGK